MMKLYYSAGSCSMSCHITLEEAGVKYEAIEVDFDNANDPNIALTAKLNQMGTLPVFITEDGKQLDQNISIHLYAADKAKDKKLVPAAGTFEYFETMNMLSFVAADLHKAVGGLFVAGAISSEVIVKEHFRKFQLDRAHQTLAYVESKLNGRDYIMGSDFTVVDAYAFTVIGWTNWLEVPLTEYKNIQGYMKRVEERPAVHRVLVAEGMIETK